MKNGRRLLDAFVLSGFVASFFSGFLNPLYVSLILSRLDGGRHRHRLIHVVGVARAHRAGPRKARAFRKAVRGASLGHACRAGRGAGLCGPCRRGPAGLLPGVDVRPGRVLLVGRLPACRRSRRCATAETARPSTVDATWLMPSGCSLDRAWRSSASRSSAIPLPWQGWAQSRPPWSMGCFSCSTARCLSGESGGPTRSRTHVPTRHRSSGVPAPRDP